MWLHLSRKACQSTLSRVQAPCQNSLCVFTSLCRSGAEFVIALGSRSSRCTFRNCKYPSSIHCSSIVRARPVLAFICQDQAKQYKLQDEQYKAAGATIVNATKAFQSQIVLKVQPPNTVYETAKFTKGSTLMSWIEPESHERLLTRLQEKQMTVICTTRIVPYDTAHEHTVASLHMLQLHHIVAA